MTPSQSINLAGAVYCPLPYGVLRITGAECASFLQGLITQDIHQVSPTRATYSLLLSPQGKYQYDFFILAEADGYLLLVIKDQLLHLQRRLSLYKLRRNITIEAPSQAVYAVFGAKACATLGLPEREGATQALSASSIAYTDPRWAPLGSIVVARSREIPVPLAEIPYAPLENYQAWCYGVGVPFSQDMIVDKGIPLECGMEELQAISWQKGCYMGQELTARTKYRGLVRKRLFPVSGKVLPPFGTPLLLDGQKIGAMRGSIDGVGLALLRLEAVQGKPTLPIDDHSPLQVHTPPWMQCTIL